MRSVKEWQLQEAKSKLSEVVKEANNAPQTITLHGKPAAVIISFKDYRKLTEQKKTLIDVMQSAPKEFNEILLERDTDTTLRDISL